MKKLADHLRRCEGALFTQPGGKIPNRAAGDLFLGVQRIAKVGTIHSGDPQVRLVGQANQMDQYPARSGGALNLSQHHQPGLQLAGYAGQILAIPSTTEDRTAASKMTPASVIAVPSSPLQSAGRCDRALRLTGSPRPDR